MLTVFHMCTCLECHPHPVYLAISNLSFETLQVDLSSVKSSRCFQKLLTLCSHLRGHLHLDAFDPEVSVILIIFTFLFSLQNCEQVEPPRPHEN